MNSRDTARSGRLAGVDYGLKRIGLALCDPAQSLASPADVMTSTGSPRRDAEQVLEWVNRNEAIGIVVGLPLSMDGSDSEQTRTVRAFARLIEETAAQGGTSRVITVELFDERLSSFQADELLRDSGLSSGKKKSRQDAVAAQAILQGYLEAREGDSKR